ncbi:MAG TPA: alpha/beta hydrolase [Xanthobacteraceae bacterium]|nr:alpha/beta hydrolase [Xanthobacteraceae bacterium]
MQILIVPGLGGSGPDHWQSHWERSYPGATRVMQSDWSRPVRPLWLERLVVAVERGPGAILAGHSLGCALIAALAVRHPDLPIGGALLVAPADVDRAHCVSPRLSGFAPMPCVKLPFRAVVVASTNDPYMTIDRARFLAKAWGAGLVNAGPCGHINVAAGFGPWPAGEKILDELIGECRFHARLNPGSGPRAVFGPDIAAPDSVAEFRPARPAWLFRAEQGDQP